MKRKALRLFAIVTLALLSADAFADGRHSGRGGYSHGARYSHSSRAYVSYARPRPYVVGAYVAPVYDPYYYGYSDYGYSPYVAYAPYPRYRANVGYRPYPVYPSRSGLVISAHIGIH